MESSILPERSLSVTTIMQAVRIKKIPIIRIILSILFYPTVADSVYCFDLILSRKLVSEPFYRDGESVFIDIFRISCPESVYQSISFDSHAGVVGFNAYCG